MRRPSATKALKETRGAQDRARVVAQQLLGLGVAQDGRAAILGRGNRRRHGDRNRRDQRGQSRGLVRRWAEHGYH
jgi:hypothetical protein